MDWRTITAADAFAISMIGVIFLGMAVVAMMFLCMRRSAMRRDPQVEALLEELDASERARPAPPSGKDGKARPARPARTWERDGDWWKP